STANGWSLTPTVRCRRLRTRRVFERSHLQSWARTGGSTSWTGTLNRPGFCIRSVQSPGRINEMPAKKEYTPGFKEQAVRFVLEEIEPDESRKQACERLAPRLSMKAVTLYNWVKQSAPAKARPTGSPGSVEELRAQNAALRKE